MDSSEPFAQEILSRCPECNREAPARIFERDGRIFQQALCSEHPSGETMIFSDAGLYRKLDHWNRLVHADDDGSACEDYSCNPPLLAVIDLTNRCNYSCPLCFAGGDNTGGFYYLPLDRVRSMLESLLKGFEVPCRHVQFSGGEPTLHPEFPEILRLARSLGFTHIQVATNGSRFVSPEYTAMCEEAGLETLYLQFDGVDDDVYLKLRGRRLLQDKIAAVENVVRTNMRIVLVPTISAPVNVGQIGPIFDFALRYSTHITGISVQPAADIGRTEVNGGGASFNLADLAREFSRQTGLTHATDDWFPLNSVAMINRAVSRLRGEPMPSPACDAHCSLGAYFFIDERNRPTCVTRFLDLKRFLDELHRIASRPAANGMHTRISQVLAMKALADCFHQDRAPEGMTFLRLLRGLEGWEDKCRGRGPGWESIGFNGMFVAGMHFMDPRNYNFRRLRRCIIQYVTTGREFIPFCSYNAGSRRRMREELERGRL